MRAIFEKFKENGQTIQFQDLQFKKNKNKQNQQQTILNKIFAVIF